MENVTIAFPNIPEVYYPSKRSDGLLGQYFNLTRIPLDIPIDPSDCFALDFHIAIHFQLPQVPLFHNHIRDLVKCQEGWGERCLGRNCEAPPSPLRS